MAQFSDYPRRIAPSHFAAHRSLEEDIVMHKRVALAVLVILGLLASAMPAFADEPVTVYPPMGGTYDATTTDSIHLFWGWIAATKGLVRVNIGHTAETYTLLDSQDRVIWSLDPGEADAYWGPIVQFDPADWGWDCPMRQIAASWWEVTIPPLPEGTYTLVFDGVYEQPVNDALHACRDVGMPVPTPSLYRGEVAVESTIIVSD